MDDRNNVDVVVIGAGVAGLAAARELRAAGHSIAVLEARSRIGGRIHTYRDPALPVPVELGAEFLHGVTEHTDRIIEEAKLTAVDVVGDHWQAEDGHFSRSNDFFEEVDEVLGKLDEHRTPDRSFADFLAERASRPNQKRKHARARRLAMEFVQGFHAADPALVSERWLANGGDPGESPEEQRMGRVLQGYDRVPAWLAREVFDAIELNTVVTTVEWSRGEVIVTARDGSGGTRTIHARTAIITVPIGVLHLQKGETGAIEFTPDVPAMRDAIGGIAMGPVLHIAFAFRERFWEKGLRNAPKEGLACLSFVHSPGSTVPVWWSLFPVRAPVLVGWVGGPPAAALAELSDEDIERRALHDLARHLGTTYERLAGLVRGTYMHNWSDDPFARGAYSYAIVGGSNAARKLSRPVEQTLFFAGEATDTEGRSATVEGALASGHRAARAVIQALA